MRSDPHRLAAAAQILLAIGVVFGPVMAGTRVAAETIDPNNDGSQYAWTENAG
jgi:hypothetical protein